MSLHHTLLVTSKLNANLDLRRESRLHIFVGELQIYTIEKHVDGRYFCGIFGKSLPQMDKIKYIELQEKPIILKIF